MCVCVFLYELVELCQKAQKPIFLVPKLLEIAVETMSSAIGVFQKVVEALHVVFKHSGQWGSVLFSEVFVCVWEAHLVILLRR